MLRIFVVAIVLIQSALVFAQTTGSIRGTVSDSDGQPIPGATVVIQSDALIGGSRTAYTNELGVFRFPSLPIGIYQIQASLGGFETVQAQNVKVSLNATAGVGLTMKPTMTESLSVSGEAPLIDPAQSGLSTTYSKELVKELPTQRNMWDLMQ